MRALIRILASFRDRPGDDHAGRRRHAPQGHHRCRGRAREPADRLRRRDRPQRHRRQPAQLRLHPPEPRIDDGAARHQHAQRQPQHRQRRGGDGDREPAALCHQWQPHRCHRLRDVRLRKPRRRRAPRDAPARRRRPGLCGRAGLRRGRRLHGRGQFRDFAHPQHPDQRPHSQRRADRTRSSVRPRRPERAAAGAAQPGLHDGEPRRQQRSTPSSAPMPPPPPIPARCACAVRRTSATWPR